MKKINKLVGACLMGIIALCSSVASAEFLKPIVGCPKNQYMAGNLCETCPAHAVCDGVNAKCEEGYQDIKKNRSVVCKKIECSKDKYLVGKNCAKCPRDATCDGQNAKCKQGTLEIYHKTGRIQCSVICPTDIKKCSENEYMVKDPCEKCVKCPKNATCNGQLVKCQEGYVAKKKGAYITCEKKTTVCPIVIPKCSKDQYMVKDPCEKCVKCPENATCNSQSAKCKKGYDTQNKNGKITCKKNEEKVKRCKQSSHDNFIQIKAKYKNCSKCETIDIAAGKCSKNKKVHKHYSCECDC